MFAKLFCRSVIALSFLLGQTTAIAEELVVRAIPERIVDAWNRGDGKALAAVYAEDGILVAGHGVVKRGRAQIAAYHEDLFATSIKGTKLTVEVTMVRFLDARTVLPQTEGGILWPGQTTLAPGNRGIQSVVVVKQGADWRVVLFQNTRILASDGQ